MEGEARIAVLETRVDRLEHDRAEEEVQLAALRDKFGLLRTDFEVLQTRVGVYAALGALAGGAVMSLVVNALGSYLNLKGGP